MTCGSARGVDGTNMDEAVSTCGYREALRTLIDDRTVGG
jgi:hypothetical protein